MLGVHIRDLRNFYARVRDNEVLATEVMGYQMEVLETEPNYRLKIKICSKHYDGKKKGVACTLIFTCPPTYPARIPSIDIADKYNIPQNFESRIYEEIDDIVYQNVGMKLITRITILTQGIMDDLEEALSVVEMANMSAN